MEQGIGPSINRTLPVVSLAHGDELYSKIVGTIEQAKARDGVIIALVTEGDTRIEVKAEHIHSLFDAGLRASSKAAEVGIENGSSEALNTSHLRLQSLIP